VTWLQDVSLRDLDDTVLIEATCLRCLHEWSQSALQLLLKVDHRDIRLDEVAKNLACPRPGCRHAGVKLSLTDHQETSGFVGGMP